MKQHTVKLTRPEINHILSHLETNDIDDPDGDPKAWYTAPLDQFVKRHVRVKDKLRKCITAKVRFE